MRLRRELHHRRRARRRGLSVAAAARRPPSGRRRAGLHRFAFQLAQFLYHLNACALCFAQEHGVCDCCGETRAWRYEGPFYCAGDGQQSLCPWCIATVACLFRCLQCSQHRLHVDMG
ncbi:CbrC family protein [uncultured Xanthomonas sp.]|uniref:CbrC family protein n=1 Tax=uncultured Xanthomonas sp. TaxID=152831 RepID=UPI0025E3B1F8|nr:CbrC family protein [uncultured Xanthomonas sp.]